MIDTLGNPEALTIKQLIAAATGAVAEWLTERKNRRAFRIGLSAAAIAPFTTKLPKTVYGLLARSPTRLRPNEVVVDRSVGSRPEDDGPSQCEMNV